MSFNNQTRFLKNRDDLEHAFKEERHENKDDSDIEAFSGSIRANLTVWTKEYIYERCWSSISQSWMNEFSSVPRNPWPDSSKGNPFFNINKGNPF